MYMYMNICKLFFNLKGENVHILYSTNVCIDACVWGAGYITHKYIMCNEQGFWFIFCVTLFKSHR